MKTTRLLGSQGGLRHSLRGSGRIKKSIVQGDKFEFAEKLKEKRNYILFVSGMGHETKEIEEINDFVPQAAPLDQLIEEREIIDNYNYLETKNIKKPPKIRSTTHHERLSIPIEKKTIKKFSTHTQSQPKSYAKTKTIKTTRFGKTLDVEEIKPYSSFTLKTEKNKSFAPSNLYETYKPNKNSLSLSKPLRTISTDDKSLPNSPKDTNQNKTITQTEKRINITKIGTREESPKNLPKYQPKPSKYNKPNRPETESNNKSLRENLGRNRPDDRKPPFGGSRPEMPRGGSAPRGGRPLDDNNLQRPEERRRPGSRPDKPGYGPKPGEKPEDRPRYGEPRTGPFGGPHGPNGPRPGDRSGPFGGPHGPNGPRPGERPGPFGGPHGPRPGEKPEPYGGPHGPKQGERPGPFERPHGPRPGERSEPYGGPHGPKPGERPGPFERPHGPRPGEKPEPYGGPHGPKQGDRPGPFGGPHGPRPGERSEPYGGPHGPRPGERPGPFGGPHGPRPGERSEPYGGPHGPKQGERPRPFGGPHGPRPGERPEPYSGPHGPKPGERPGPFGGPHGPRPGERLEPYSGPHGPKPGERPGPFGVPHGPRPGERPEPYGGPHGPRPGERPEPYSGPHGPKPEERPEPYSGPHGPRPEPYGGPHGPRPGERPDPYGGPHGPRPGDRPGPYSGPHGPRPSDRPGPYGGPHGPRPDDRPGPYGGPHGPRPGERPGPYGGPQGPRPGDRPGPFGGPHGPRPGERPGPYGGPHGPRPGDRPGPYGGPHGQRPGEKPRSGSQPKGRNTFDERAFPGRSGAPRPDNRTLPVKRPISQERGGERPSDNRFKPSQKYSSLTEQFSAPGKNPNIGGVSRIRFQQTTNSTDLGNSFNYYEDKHVVKQGRLNLPNTIHHLRGEEDDGQLAQKYDGNSSYTKTSQKITSNLNKSYTQSSNLKNINNQKGGADQGSRYTQQTTYKKITTTTSSGLGGRDTGLRSGAGKDSGIGAYTEYKKYEQKNKTSNDTNQFNRSTNFRNDVNSFISKYQFADDDEFVIIDCPVHGKQIVKRNKLKKLGLSFN